MNIFIHIALLCGVQLWQQIFNIVVELTILCQFSNEKNMITEVYQSHKVSSKIIFNNFTNIQYFFSFFHRNDLEGFISQGKLKKHIFSSKSSSLQSNYIDLTVDNAKSKSINNN